MKKIITLLLISMIVLVNCLPVFASSPYAYEDLPDFPSREVSGYSQMDYVIFKTSDTTYKLVGIFNNGSCMGYIKNLAEMGNVDYVLFSNCLASVSDYYTYTVGDTSWTFKSNAAPNGPYSQLVYSTVDIYSDDTFSEIVFPLKTPPLQVLAEVEMTQATMKQILSLVPLVISLLVFSTGLRKALQMLRQVLVQA